MFVIVKPHFTMNDVSNLVLKLNDDGKTFTVIQNSVSGLDGTNHNSMLKHFILSAVPPKEENDEETDRVSGRET